MHQRVNARFISILLLTGLLLSACGAKATKAPPKPSPSEPVQPAPGASLTVTDALGRTIEFTEPPRRIVVAGKATLTIVNTLYLFPEARDRVIALVVGQQPIGRFISLVDPTFEEKTLLEADAGPEQLAPQNPDVVLLRSFMADKLGRSLEQLNIRTIYVDLETPEQFARDVRIMGQILDNATRAEEIQSFYESRLDYIKDGLLGLSDGQKPGVLVVQYSDQGGEVALNVPPASWIQTIEVGLAGGVPIWTEAAQGSGWTVVGFEQIAAWDPDQIFVISYKGEASTIVEQLRTDARWQALGAVRNGQIHGFPSDIFSWDQPDPRWILGTTWLAGKVHPSRFRDLDMFQVASDFYQEMYGMDASLIQAQLLPSLQGEIE